MATRMAEHPAGKISEVFTDAAERQGAYDFLEHRDSHAVKIRQAIVAHTAKQAAVHEFAYVALDGTALTFTDRKQSKGLGNVGPVEINRRGLKVVSALAMAPDGQVIGLCGQQTWSRKSTGRSEKQAKRDGRNFPTSAKETQHTLDVIEQTAALFERHGTKGCFLIDRAGDAREVLFALRSRGQSFIIRGQQNRLLDGAKKRYLREQMPRRPVLGTYTFVVKASHDRPAGKLKMSVRAARMTLCLRTPRGKNPTSFEVSVVLAKSVAGPAHVEWLLLTDRIVNSFDDARDVIAGYATRWRIEEFHKTWKTGGCNVEDSQLRSIGAIETWPTLHAVVAARIERLKKRSREEGDLPASVEFSAVEIEALIAFKSQRTPARKASKMPSLQQATLWIAELGGYTGKSSGGPPGSITIGRGLETLRWIVVGTTLRQSTYGIKSDQ